ncbi:NACHT domain-containing protein [Chroococcidiopsis sp. FACHB-1243]|uniref:NACHT domain-containing protein n=1 Tax=Chroococcidiopsis sp. [FACHB-1243] TaxID=2692781 RepID=UPI0017847C75|nr:ATP-binding protein [Chroococcidiopsis sp. [FACHB-1243]]MBD2305593.1 NACHT domain-containing protein [Chroococcidiopsis sp. [FACHB-1243]]
MDFDTAIELIDRQVKAKLGRSLAKKEKDFLAAAWDGQSYEQMAKTLAHSSVYIRAVVARQVWDLLTIVITDGIKVTKWNFRSLLEKKLEILTDRQPETLERGISSSPIEIVRQPPCINCFQGRSRELTELAELTSKNRCIVIYGEAGIGKSALVVKLIENFINGTQLCRFNYVFWKAVQYGPQLDDLLDELLSSNYAKLSSNTKEQDIQAKTSSLIKVLRENRYLIVLDEIDGWLEDCLKTSSNREEIAVEYSNFFRRLIEEEHSSCIILTSRQPLKNIVKLQRSGRPCHSLKLDGLDLEAAKGMLRAAKLADECKWEQMLEPYLGNPSVVKLVSEKIIKFFDGSVAKFLSYKSELISEIYKEVLRQQYRPERLSALEKQIIVYLTEKVVDDNISVGFDRLFADLKAKSKNDVSLSDLMTAVENLDNCSLIIISKDKKTKELLFALPPLFKTYLLKQDKLQSLNQLEPISDRYTNFDRSEFVV